MNVPPHLESYRFNPEPVIRQSGDLVMTYAEFSELAEKRIRIVSFDEYLQWKRVVFPSIDSHKVMGACSYDYRAGTYNMQIPPQEKLLALDIIVRSDFYSCEREGMLKYGIEHEKWELWQRIAFNVKSHIAHLLARHHEYSLAVKAGEDGQLFAMYHTHALSVGEQLEPEHAIALEFAQQHLQQDN